MASAAKRRKAARKKKKELESHVASNSHENGDLVSENEKDSDGGVQSNSPTSEDHPHSFDEGKEGLKNGESPTLPHASTDKPLEPNAAVQIGDEMEAGDDLRIERRDVEEAVGKENDGLGSELKSNGILTVEIVEKEETEEESEGTRVSIERLEVAKELCNGESETLPMENSAEKPPEVPMIPTVVRRTSWMNFCGLLDLISGSRT